MIFEHWTYSQFYLERIATNAKIKAFSNQEVEWALKQINYKYFGEYPLTDQQSMAIDILEWVAKEYLK